jgi:hypothetical protein
MNLKVEQKTEENVLKTVAVYKFIAAWVIHSELEAIKPAME